MTGFDKKAMWEKAVAFHGHECGGLTIGYKASLYAMTLLDLKFSDDEEVVCISENDACGVDAIQVLLGCSVGKGNLLFHMTGKQAFSFYNRKTGDKRETGSEKMAGWNVKRGVVPIPAGKRAGGSVLCEKDQNAGSGKCKDL